jgi:uncharacterized protein YbjT (DUF2867 family)
MNVVIFGSTGMVGQGVLLECLADARVEKIVAVNRTPLNRSHPRLREILLEDFFQPEALRDDCGDADACFFCLGVTSVGLAEPAYTRLTFDLTLGVARAIVSPRMTFCYVSGAGTDSTERGARMWARVKGRTENALLAMPFRRAFMFRPGYIQPLKGARSKTAWYQAVYNVIGPIYPLLHRLLPRHTITTVEIGRAMIEVAASGYHKTILDPPDISAVAARSGPQTDFE